MYAQQDANAPQREPQVSSALRQSQNAAEALDKAIAELEQCLAPVLRQNPPTAGDSGKVSEVKVPLAEELGKHAARLNGFAAWLHDMRDRLEV